MIRFLVAIAVLLASTALAQDGEKQILLEFKAGVTDDPLGALSSWDPSAGSDPCRSFVGVFCGDAGGVERIVLHNASLAGVLSPALAGLRSLQILSLYGNRFAGVVPPEYDRIGSLRKLNVSRNALSGEVPAFLGRLPNLRLLDLSGNGFTGGIPPALFNSCVRLRYISLSKNNLFGQVPSLVSNCGRLEGVDLSFNNFSGGFPSALCDSPVMSYISLRSNSFDGIVPDLFGRCQNLRFLDLASNYFSGSVPFDLLSLNNFSFFNASSNGFTGQLPEIGSCSESMEILDVSRNGVGGEIPASIGKCLSLRILNLGENQIGGSIPPDVGGIVLLQILDLHNLRLSGEIPEALSSCQFLLEFDASGNQLEGGIPGNLYNATYLRLLDLHGNRLNGPIPANLGQLSRMRFLDLSVNNLTGSIPLTLGNLTLLTHFNLSSNNLTGEIPTSPIIQQFGASAFILNPGLCGPPLDSPCSAISGGGSESRGGRKLSVSVIVAIVAAGAIVAGVCIITIMNIRSHGRPWQDNVVIASTPPATSDSNVIIGKLVLFSKTLPSTYEDWEAGTKALLDKDCLIGGGSIGTVYKTTFEGGVSIAVKKLETLGRIRNQDEFEQEVGRLGNLGHPNLVAFQGYYWSSSMQLILSEFVPNGNLYQHLHEYTNLGSSSGSSQSDLHWSRRFRIALSAARALAYLHHDCKPQVLHLNIKSTNIILDYGFEPKVSDYGLGKLLPILGNNALTKFHTSVGYVAPELASQGLSLRYGDKCDVYSYGVILLELVTGRKPVESPAAREVVILRDHVRDLLEKGSASDCFDRRLRGFAEIELIQVLKLGLVCTSEVPTRRPSMGEVVQILESIRTNSDSS